MHKVVITAKDIEDAGHRAFLIESKRLRELLWPKFDAAKLTPQQLADLLEAGLIHDNGICIQVTEVGRLLNQYRSI